MTTLYETVVSRVKHALHMYDDGPDRFDELMRRRSARLMLPADAAAGDATNYVLLKAETGLRLVSVDIAAAAVVTADADNYAILDLNKEDGAAGGLTSLDTTNTKTGEGGTLAARVPRSYSIAITDTLDAGEVLVLEVTKAGTGVVVTDLLVDIHYEVL